MKNTGKCPKCGCKEIILAKGMLYTSAAGNNIQLGSGFRLAGARVDRYICCACGFSEEWIKSDDLPLLIEECRSHRKVTMTPLSFHHVDDNGHPSSLKSRFRPHINDE
ncbi:MAG: hypothetical protein E7559_03290 [Ruminococcaceae bacterium]|nr:hypothetical protein [Oscillospiraceae bacterium]